MSRGYDIVQRQWFACPVGLGPRRSSSGSSSSFSLNSANARIAWRFQVPKSLASITAFTFWQGALTGTQGNVTYTVRLLEASTNSTKPGTAVLAEETGIAAHPNGVIKPIRVVFTTPYEPVDVGEVYWVTVANAASVPGTDFPQVRRAFAYGRQSSAMGQMECFTSTDNFATNGSASQGNCGLLEFSDGLVWGEPVTEQSANFTNNQEYRGVIWPAFPYASFALLGFDTNVVANWNRVRVYAFDEPPTGTPLYDEAWGTEKWSAYTFTTPFILQRNKSYRIVFNSTSNTANPVTFRSTNFADIASDLPNLHPDPAYLLHGCQASGSSWVDKTYETPNIWLHLATMPLRGGAS